MLQSSDKINITNREKEVLIYVAAGKSNKAIGICCQVSEQTIKNHMTHLMYKFNTQGRTETVVLALLFGIITFNEIIQYLGK